MLSKILKIIDIWKWHKNTFPQATSKSQLIKLQSEINEVVDAKKELRNANNYQMRNIKRKHVREELIDVIITSINCLRYQDIYEDVCIKMSSNKQRDWNTKTMHHKENDNGK
ncbi:MAG: hypothetical protein KBT03_13595 [Bacteroidales bacterium]|nr:hypothetical protein [Candidatus Scybalousia scybalohippi]